MIPIGSPVFCRGYSQWGVYTFNGVIENYSYKCDDENFPTKTINGYLVRKQGGSLETIWLRDAELVT